MPQTKACLPDMHDVSTPTPVLKNAKLAAYARHFDELDLKTIYIYTSAGPAAGNRLEPDVANLIQNQDSSFGGLPNPSQSCGVA